MGIAEKAVKALRDKRLEVKEASIPVGGGVARSVTRAVASLPGRANGQARGVVFLEGCWRQHPTRRGR